MTPVLVRYRALVLLLGLLSLTACSSADVQRYANNQPRLLLSEFFAGELSAHGIVKNRSGELIRYFNASIKASWDEAGNGQLDERFVFDDGEQQRRVWQLVKQADGSYLASANDVATPAPIRLAGNAMFMDYVLSLQYRGKPLDVVVEDKMYLVNPTTLINESRLTKFGFTVGSISLVITKQR